MPWTTFETNKPLFSDVPAELENLGLDMLDQRVVDLPTAREIVECVARLHQLIGGCDHAPSLDWMNGDGWLFELTAEHRRARAEAVGEQLEDLLETCSRCGRILTDEDEVTSSYVGTIHSSCYHQAAGDEHVR